MRTSLWLVLGSICFSSYATPPKSRVTPPTSEPPPTAAVLPAPGAGNVHIAHVQKQPLTAAQRPPKSSSRQVFRTDYDRPLRNQSTQTRMLLTQATTTCDTSAFASASGGNLVNLVKSSTLDCLNTLFSVTGAQAGQVFPEAKMVTIANAMQTEAVTYSGSNSDDILQLIEFLRAGYYVQYYDPSDVGTYGTALKQAIEPALDAFIANAHFTDVNEQHGQVLSEFVTLIDSASENAHELSTVMTLLKNYNSSYHAYPYMMTAVNNVFTVLFRGHYDADFVAAVQDDPSIAEDLSNFITANAVEAGTANEYLLANAATEMTRFLQYPDIAATVRPLVKSVLGNYAMTGTGASIWVAAASSAYYYDQSNCSYYGICNYKAELEQTVLPISHTCSPTLKLRAESLTSAQITHVCDEVMGETDYFHQKVQDNDTPVADDHNTTLELDIFKSSTDYATYAGAIFGNSTDNGGIYLEGDPSDPANQPRFIAYQAEWLEPTFEIWNLTHEYVHYLDGRFDMYGDFNDYTTVPSVWWMEGLAEYMSYSYRNVLYPEAIADAGTQQYPLSTIFANDYNSGEERVYRWGYLAVRYMFEKQYPEVTTMLGYFRAGNYTGYANWLASIKYSHDADWDTWLACLNTGNGDTSACGGSTTPPPNTPPGGGNNPPPSIGECTDPDTSVLGNNCKRSNLATSRSGDTNWFYIYVPAGTTDLHIQTGGGTGNADLYVSASTWPTPSSYDAKSTQSGNDESIDIANPATGGYYYVSVYAAAPYSDVYVSASMTSGGSTTPPPSQNLPECTGSDDSVLANGCQRSGRSEATAGGNDYLYIWVPQGTTQLNIQTQGGTGNADLYVSGNSYPQTTSYDAKSTNSGNDESVTINAPTTGTYYYVMLNAVAPFSGVNVSATLD
ncbi:MAG TPA: M9 family metallopeptidase [Rhodanobacteraceae bacterium]